MRATTISSTAQHSLEAAGQRGRPSAKRDVEAPKRRSPRPQQQQKQQQQQQQQLLLLHQAFIPFASRSMIPEATGPPNEQQRETVGDPAGDSKEKHFADVPANRRLKGGGHANPLLALASWLAG
ncbi:hypothetical protein ACSSS7_006820 [Eimeria intestinalis]